MKNFGWEVLELVWHCALAFFLGDVLVHNTIVDGTRSEAVLASLIILAIYRSAYNTRQLHHPDKDS